MIEIPIILLLAFLIFFLINIIDYMKKSIRQREDQINQMDRFLELYKKVNNLDFSSKKSH